MALNYEKLPILGGLFRSTIKDHSSALLELILTLIFSFVPIFIAVLGDYLKEYPYFPGLCKSFIHQISNGELIIFTTSLSAPIFYLVMRKREEDAFPSKIAFILFFVIIIMTSVVVFTMQRVTDVNKQALFNVSTIVFALMIVTLYLVMCYSSALTQSPAKEMGNQTSEYSNGYAEHRGAT